MACGLRYVLMDAAVIGSQACVAAQASQQFTRADFLEMRSEILILRERLERLSKKVEQSKGGSDRQGRHASLGRKYTRVCALAFRGNQANHGPSKPRECIARSYLLGTQGWQDSHILCSVWRNHGLREF